MIALPLARWRRAALTMKNMWKMLVRKVVSSCSSVISVISAFGNWTAALLTRISSRPSSAYRSLNGFAAESLTAHVARDQQAAPAVFLNHRAGLLGIIVFVQIHNRHVRAFLRIGDCCRPPDATVAAGDQRNHALQLTRPAVFGIVIDRVPGSCHRSPRAAGSGAGEETAF